MRLLSLVSLVSLVVVGCSSSSPCPTINEQIAACPCGIHRDPGRKDPYPDPYGCMRIECYPEPLCESDLSSPDLTQPADMRVPPDLASPDLWPCAPEGEILCGGQCVDTSRDRNNCGRCGNQCPPGGACMGSKCAGCLN